jgi:hypothetical protein
LPEEEHSNNVSLEEPFPLPDPCLDDLAGMDRPDGRKDTASTSPVGIALEKPDVMTRRNSGRRLQRISYSSGFFLRHSYAGAPIVAQSHKASRN